MDLRGYFTFSKKERIGIVALLLIMGGFAVLPKFWKKAPPKMEVTMPAIAARVPERKFYNDSSQVYYRARERYTNYPSFRKRPYSNYTSRYTSYEDKSRPKEYRPRSAPQIIDINSADTSAFIALPGIGSKLAVRIITFRERLGGFYSVNQVGEIYGLQDSAFRTLLPYLKCDSASIRRININDSDKETLKQHPYIRWNLANVLVAYRTAHGRFTSALDLEKVNNLDTSSLKRLLPYLTF
ncbi:MAG: helix-hairpin-helix domain-containing protein [Flavitalea sp.]